LSIGRQAQRLQEQVDLIGKEEQDQAARGRDAEGHDAEQGRFPEPSVAMGLALPSKRITVNLAPADLTKEGSHFDLPVALGLLAAMDKLPADEIARYTALGELALDGGLAPVAGVLPAAVHTGAGEGSLICPDPQGPEAAWAGDIEVLAPASLLALVNHFTAGALGDRWATGICGPPSESEGGALPVSLPLHVGRRHRRLQSG